MGRSSRGAAGGRRRLGALAGWLIVLAGMSGPAAAFERGTSDRFLVSLGTYIMDFNTEASLSSSSGDIGTDINFEDDLGLTSGRSEVRLDGYWRFGARHRLDFGSFYFGRDAERTLDREITWGDLVFPVSARVSTETSTTIIKLAYKYSFHRGERFEWGASFGLSTLITKAELSGDAQAGGGGTSFQGESDSVTAPIPVFGLHGEFAISRQVFVRGSVEYFHISLDEQEGSLTDSRLTFDWYPLKHFGFGVGYNRFVADYEDVGRGEIGFRYEFSGPQGYVTYVF